MAVNLIAEGFELTVTDDQIPNVEDGDPGTTYIVRQITPARTRVLRQKHTTRPVNKNTGMREERVDNDALIDDLVDEVLVGWQGILLQGQPAPCERANKLLLDFSRKQGLIVLAGTNVADIDRERSFRGPADVVPHVDRSA